MTNGEQPKPSQNSAYLPAERVSASELERQRQAVVGSAQLTALLDATLGFSLVLNEQRQVVHINDAFRGFLEQRGTPLRLGLRPGELLSCVNAPTTDGGCGTAEACRYCGAAHSLAGAAQGSSGLHECRIQGEDIGDDLDLLVKSSCVEIDGERFIVFAAIDISHEKRRRTLERIFFHDVINTAGGIKGLAGVMSRSAPYVAVKYAPLLATATSSLLDEIVSHRELTRAEHDELPVKVTRFSTLALLSELAELCTHHAVGLGRSVTVTANSDDIFIESDRVLLLRVMANLLKNALEAEPTGSTVTTSCQKVGDKIRFEVHNASVMPREVQMQMFQRSFTTKGPGRGLGAYSIRLLTERYLGGKVSFVSTEEAGTRFTAEYPTRLAARVGS